MRAVLCKAFGPPETLVVEDVPSPKPAAGQVRIAVRAAGVNFADTLVIEGKYQEKPPFPFTPGAEFSGDVVELGPGVQGLRVGDRVMGTSSIGAFAEELVAPADAVMKISDRMGY